MAWYGLRIRSLIQIQSFWQWWIRIRTYKVNTDPQLCTSVLCTVRYCRYKCTT
jgi:hypothetical protein